LARLYPEEAVQQAQVSCAACSSPCRVISGNTFAAKDRELFDAIGRAMVDAKLSLPEARALQTQLDESIENGSYARLLTSLSPRMPLLTVTGVAIGRSSVAQRRALLMLKAIVDGTLSGATRDALDMPSSMPLDAPIEGKFTDKDVSAPRRT
jgi:hypothetical protein